MSESHAIDAIKTYAEKCGFQLQTLLEKQIPSWLKFDFRWYSFTYHTGNGILITAVLWPGHSVKRFEFYPTDGKSFMLPLWLAYPDFTSETVGWRMGSGEAYFWRWRGWYDNLSDEEKTDFRKRYPEPEDSRGWAGFYDRLRS
jgi:hypothetical protein